MTINEIQDEIIEEFAGFDDWMDKYQLLIDVGNEQAPLDEQYKTDQNLIDGCQSRVWLQADYADGKIHFTAESDALIVKGIVALLIRVLSDHTPQEIIDADTHYNDRITVALRTSDGLNLDKLSDKYRSYCLREAQRFIDDGLLRYDGHHLVLTRKGLFVSDYIMGSLVYA